MKNGRIAEWKKKNKRTVWRGKEVERRRRRKRIKHNEENFTCVGPLYLLASEKYQKKIYIFYIFLHIFKIFLSTRKCYMENWKLDVSYLFVSSCLEGRVYPILTATYARFWANLCPNTWLCTRHGRERVFSHALILQLDTSRFLIFQDSPFFVYCAVCIIHVIIN